MRINWPFAARITEISAGVVAALAAVILLTFVLVDRDGSAESPQTGPSANSSSHGGTPRPSRSNSPIASADTLRCLFDDSVVPCTMKHNVENIKDDTCEHETLVAYLGGDPAVDILAPNVRISRLSSGCQIRFDPPSGQPMRGILQKNLGADYRYCVSQLPKMVYSPCSEGHSGEIVFLTDNSQYEYQCDSEATIYLGTPWAQVSNELSLVRISTSGQWGCLVEARGKNSLIQTVRNLGQNAIPLSSK